MGFLKDIYEFRKLRKELLRVYKDDNLVNRFSDLYKLNFKVDRAARMYAVMNPLLMNIKTGSSQAYEYTTGGMNDYEYIRQWILTNLMAVAPALAAENLLDVLLFDIKELLYDGKPSGNYLITFKPYNFDDYVKAKKKLGILLGILIPILIAIVITLLIIF